MISLGFVVGFIGILMVTWLGKSMLSSRRQKDMDKRWAFHWQKVNEEQERLDEEKAQRQRKLVEDELQKAKERDQLRAKRHAAYLGVMKEPKNQTKNPFETFTEMEMQLFNRIPQQYPGAGNSYGSYGGICNGLGNAWPF